MRRIGAQGLPVAAVPVIAELANLEMSSVTRDGTVIVRLHDELAYLRCWRLAAMYGAQLWVTPEAAVFVWRAAA